jgi:hypothetical protein
VRNSTQQKNSPDSAPGSEALQLETPSAGGWRRWRRTTLERCWTALDGAQGTRCPTANVPHRYQDTVQDVHERWGCTRAQPHRMSSLYDAHVRNHSFVPLV